MSITGSTELKQALQRLVRGRGPQPLPGGKGQPPPRPDLAPGCSFGAVVEARLKALDGEVGEVRARVNGLLFLLAGAIATQVVLKLLGW